MLRSIKGKLLILTFIPILLFSLLIFFYILPSIHENIYNEKEIQTKNMVQMVLSITDYYYKMEENGQLTRGEAQDRAKNAIRAIRFGENGQDYFWVNDFEPKVIVHPFKPELEGKDASGIQDPDGVKIFVEFAEIAQNQGGGYVPYAWQYYDDQTRIEPKLSYVASFEPWQWAIGTGIYVNDVNELVAGKKQSLILAFIIVIFVTVLTVILYAHKNIVKPLIKLKDCMVLAEQGDLTVQSDIVNSDEIGVLSHGFNQMIIANRNLVQDINA
ncbi:MAG: methyl-accepting chemotaxis protein, partial [Clostridia bacterium]|nr:methyl-accepting chemotaxis protein [Clostridia bacterium]